MAFNCSPMKKLLSIFLLFIALQSMAQGNLQFNQVINIKNGDTYTVPAGKVLKITSVSQSSNSKFELPLLRCEYSSGYPYCIYDLNIIIGTIGNLTFKPAYSTYSYNGTVTTNIAQCNLCPTTYDFYNGNTIGVATPFWLKSGQIITINSGSGILISAIEFNIVP